ncbi:MAG: hypothetical protein PHE07_01635 [Bacteroidales bacterium]|nr:hypothetical protein [Bacteroidales bacterium]
MNTLFYFLIAFIALILLPLIVAFFIKQKQIRDLKKTNEDLQKAAHCLSEDLNLELNKRAELQKRLVTLDCDKPSGTDKQVVMRALMKIADKVYEAGALRHDEKKTTITVLT